MRGNQGRKIKIAILTMMLCMAMTPVINRYGEGSMATVEAAAKLKLTNVGNNKTLYQYLTFAIKTNVKASKCKFTSGNKKVATVSSKGVVTAKKKGTTTITVKYGSQKKKIKLTVKTASKNYSPSRVAKIANQRLSNTQNKNGEKMVSLPDLKKRLLKEGKITQKEYDKNFVNGKYDASINCGSYLICFYELNLNETISLGGNRLKTESAIANDIIGYYKVGYDKYFYVQYAGKRTVAGKTYYEFHLYNA